MDGTSDGVNDAFYIQGNEDIAMIRTLKVFDRWGEMVFESSDTAPNDADAGWDGTFKDKALNSGVFGWTAEIEYIDGSVEVVKGSIMLIR